MEQNEKQEIKEIVNRIIDSDSAFNKFLVEAEDDVQLVAMYNAFTVAAINCQSEAKDKMIQAEVNHEKAMRIVNKLNKLGAMIKGAANETNNSIN